MKRPILLDGAEQLVTGHIGQTVALSSWARDFVMPWADGLFGVKGLHVLDVTP